MMTMLWWKAPATNGPGNEAVLPTGLKWISHDYCDCVLQPCVESELRCCCWQFYPNHLKHFGWGDVLLLSLTLTDHHPVDTLLEQQRVFKPTTLAVMVPHSAWSVTHHDQNKTIGCPCNETFRKKLETTVTNSGWAGGFTLSYLCTYTLTEMQTQQMWLVNVIYAQRLYCRHSTFT